MVVKSPISGRFPKAWRSGHVAKPQRVERDGHGEWSTPGNQAENGMEEVECSHLVITMGIFNGINADINGILCVYIYI